MSVMVCDASSLILLAKITILGEVLEELEVVITKEVKDEATQKEIPDAKLIEKAIKNGEAEVRKSPSEAKQSLKEDFQINKGEASSLALCKRMNADLLATDDGKTIDTCRILDVKYTSSINILVRTVKKGLLSRQMGLAKLTKLEDYGWYKTELIQKAKLKIRGDEDE